MSDERTPWPEPREQPEREPSHPGARRDEGDGDSWWQRWLDELDEILERRFP